MRPDDKPVLRICLSSKDAALACGVSTSYWHLLDERGLVPQPASIGGKKVWNVDLLKAWSINGCPARDSAAWQRLLETLRQEAGQL